MSKKLKIIIADVVDNRFPKEKLEYRMAELENLVKTYGGVVIVKKIQKRWRPDYKTYIWWGKLEEIKEIISTSWADVLILWNILKPFQVFNLNEELRELNVKAWDRVDLILKIFDLHAKSPEAKLQIELASIKHMGPRIFGMGMELSKQWAWIWTKGIWETNTEIMKRHLQKRKQQIEEKLKHYEKVREQHRLARTRKNLNTVGIVWYTNAGKSSLLNSMTWKWVLAEDKLFATLWTSVWEVFLSPYDLWYKDVKCEWSSCKKVLLNDTVWFIQDLPPSLIQAFKSTLEDSIESNILFHIIDISDPFMEEKIDIVEDILNQIWANQEKIYVFNKIDNLTEKKILEKKERIKELWEKLELKNWKEDKQYFFTSTYKKLWIDDLKKYLYNKF